MQKSSSAILSEVRQYETTGKVVEVKGGVITASIAGLAVGDLVVIEKRFGAKPQLVHSARLCLPQEINPEKVILGEVLSYNESTTCIFAYDHTDQIVPGARVISICGPLTLGVGRRLLGHVLDCLGDIRGNLCNLQDEINTTRPLSTISYSNTPPDSFSNSSEAGISQPFVTGIRAIDAFTTIGCGQRLGVYAEPGVGKTTLIGSLARSTSADITVVSLVGERRREVTEFIRSGVSPDVARKTIVVAATSSESAILRMRAAYTALRIAEYFRDQGRSVLLLVDSLTRMFRAMRDVGLAAGESPVRRGYPLSVFTRIPEFIERSGKSNKGTITAIYTILLSSDIDEDPMVEETKGLLDGHLYLSKELAERGHYPAIDIGRSLSRFQRELLPEASYRANIALRRAYAMCESNRELLMLGGTADEELKAALAVQPRLLKFLQQSPEEVIGFGDTLESMHKLMVN